MADAFGVLGNKNGGYHIVDVTVTYHGKTYKVQPTITDTRMQVRLNSPIGAKRRQHRCKDRLQFCDSCKWCGPFRKAIYQDRGCISNCTMVSTYVCV